VAAVPRQARVHAVRRRQVHPRQAAAGGGVYLQHQVVVAPRAGSGGNSSARQVNAAEGMARDGEKRCGSRQAARRRAGGAPSAERRHPNGRQVAR